MTQEEKQLLLKELSARAFYGVKAHYVGGSERYTYEADGVVLSVDIYLRNPVYVNFINTEVELVKPYLRPMSSMTDEEHGQYMEFIEWSYNDYTSISTTCINKEKLHEYMDFIYSHHLDDNNLIEKGLALEAPEGMYEDV